MKQKDNFPFATEWNRIFFETLHAQFSFTAVSYETDKQLCGVSDPLVNLQDLRAIREHTHFTSSRHYYSQFEAISRDCLDGSVKTLPSCCMPCGFSLNHRKFHSLRHFLCYLKGQRTRLTLWSRSWEGPPAPSQSTLPASYPSLRASQSWYGKSKRNSVWGSNLHLFCVQYTALRSIIILPSHSQSSKWPIFYVFFLLHPIFMVTSISFLLWQKYETINQRAPPPPPWTINL